MGSHSAQTFVAFLTDVVGMEIQFQMRVPGEILEKTHLRDIAPERGARRIHGRIFA
jgi:hypothetical protein